MAIRQDRYVAADTNKVKKVDIIEVPQVPDDPVLRRSDVQQQVNNSTLPVSSRAVNLAIESINSDLDLKADKTELEGLATEDYVNEKIDEKEIGITEPELISKSVGLGKWMREGAGGILGKGEDIFSTTPEGIDASQAGWSSIYAEVPNTPDFSQSGDMLLSGIWNNSGTRKVQQYFGLNSNRVVWRWSTGSKFSPFFEYFTDANTGVDSNGVLHNSRNPIDTLNTSDMADTVVDNDLITVTSGAVFRAIKQLTDQITSLETRVRELEDGEV